MEHQGEGRLFVLGHGAASAFCHDCLNALGRGVQDTYWNGLHPFCRESLDLFQWSGKVPPGTTTERPPSSIFHAGLPGSNTLLPLSFTRWNSSLPMDKGGISEHTDWLSRLFGGVSPMPRPHAPRLSGRISLQVPPGVHLRLREIADRLGPRLVELLNLMIVEHLPQYAQEADEKARQADQPSDRVSKQRHPQSKCPSAPGTRRSQTHPPAGSSDRKTSAKRKS